MNGIPHKSSNPTTQRFMFATGIECSYPTIRLPDGRVKRMDELEKTRHYDYWREDLQLVHDLGTRYLRYGPPYYRIHVAPGRYDWSWPDQVLPELRRLGLIPILDLCHFGVPDWIENFQNPEFPGLFAEYARAIAARYSWIRFYTPVNEIFVCARYSAETGWWNERLQSDRAFVTALKHLVRANVEAMQRILEVRPDALFVQSESSQYVHAWRPSLVREANFCNERRFLSLDLNYGHEVSARMYEYLCDNGLTPAEYAYFMACDLREHCVMGNDYYAQNEYLLVQPGKLRHSGEVFGYAEITREYYERYNLPVMHTETNQAEPDAERWLWKTWANIIRLRKNGVPLCGMTWYSLQDQVDWDTALREDNGRVNPFGLCDLSRNLRPVGRAYRELIREWSFIPLLPNGPLTLAGFWAEAGAGEVQEEELPSDAAAEKRLERRKE